MRKFIDMDGVLVATPIMEHNVYRDAPTSWWRNLGHTTLFNDFNFNDPNTYILSHPCSAASAAGKWLWLLDRGIDPEDKLILTKNKHLLAKPNDILYDDLLYNIRMWELNGGIGRHTVAIY